MSENWLALNRRGRNRLVLLVGSRAYKLPSMRSWRDFLFGLLNNLNEAEWAHGNSHACPVLWRLPGGFLNAMPRVRTLTQGEFDAFDYWEFKTTSGLRPEQKPDSFGWLNGAVVAVDFGW